MWGYFSIEFIDFILKGKSLLNDTNLFSPNDYENNAKILLKNNTKIFSITTKKFKKFYYIICGKYRKFEKPKIS